jgi:hypothetical protein
VEKKVTRRPSRVSIIVQVLGNQDTPRSTHRIWAAEGWSSALVWVSAWMAQTGVAVRLLIKRERHVERHVLASGRTPLFFCLGASCPHDPLDCSCSPGNYQKTPGGRGGRMPPAPKQKTWVSGGLSRALYCRHIAVLPPLSPIWGGTPMWVTLRDQIWSKI